MKTCLLLIILINIFLETPAHSQIPQRKGYELGINSASITKPKDTTVFWGKKRYRYVTVPVKLINLTNDRLVYINFSCSTFEIFTTNNENVEVELQPCTKNWPTTFTIESHQSSVTNLRLFFPRKSRCIKYQFAVGMYLCMSNDNCAIEILGDRKHWSKNMIIWSNEVTIPKP